MLPHRNTSSSSLSQSGVCITKVAERSGRRTFTFRVQGLVSTEVLSIHNLRVSDLASGFGIQDGFRVWSSGCVSQGLGFGLWDLRCRVEGGGRRV